MSNSQIAVGLGKRPIVRGRQSLFSWPTCGSRMAQVWPTENFSMVISTIGLMARLLMLTMQDRTRQERLGS